MAIRTDDVSHTLGVVVRVHYDDTTGVRRVDPKGNRYVDYVVVKVEIVNPDRRQIAVSRVGGVTKDQKATRSRAFNLSVTPTRQKDLGGIGIAVSAAR